MHVDDSEPFGTGPIRQCCVCFGFEAAKRGRNLRALHFLIRKDHGRSFDDSCFCTLSIPSCVAEEMGSRLIFMKGLACLPAEPVVNPTIILQRHAPSTVLGSLIECASALYCSSFHLCDTTV